MKGFQFQPKIKTTISDVLVCNNDVELLIIPFKLHILYAISDH